MPPGTTFEDEGRVMNIPDVKVIYRGEYRCTVTRENGQSDSKIVMVPVDGGLSFTVLTKNFLIYLHKT